MSDLDSYAPFDLRCEYAENPLGVDEKQPVLSWKLNHSKKNEKQSAYQIIISSSLENDTGDMWDTGKVVSQDQLVKYNGKELLPFKTYYWKVRWWDSEDRVSPYSEIAKFEMGILNRSNWKAKWISKKEHKYEENAPEEAPFGRTYTIAYAPLFRKEFMIEKKIKRARAYISGLGLYELYINGQKIGDRVLDPGQTDYNKRVLYTVYCVDSNVKMGENAIGIILGNGRYVKDYGYDFPKLTFQLLIEYEDRTQEFVISDETWKVTYGPISMNSLYHGEIYDARKEISGWDLPKFNDKNWEEAVEVEGPLGELNSEIYPPIKIVQTLKPIKMWSPKQGLYVYDFGQNFTGWAKLYVESPGEGKEIRIRYSELVYDDGTLNTATNRTALATDVYITKGDNLEIYEPKFTYHGFRYVEVSGYPRVPTLESIEGRVVHTALEPIGEFISSNELINKIHNNIIWGQLSNFMSVPTDCPQRDERMGWMGDAQLSAEEAVFNFDMIGFYKKYLNDIKDAQKEDGSLSDVIPPYWSLYPGDPAWSSAYITIAWYLYKHYGDETILEDHYEGFKKYLMFLSKLAPNYTLNFYKYGDWCQPGTVRPKDFSGELVSTWYFYHDTLILSKIAKILNKNEDYEYFYNLAEKIKDAFNKKFLKEKAYSCTPYEFDQESLEKAIEKYPEEVKEIMRQHFTIMSSLDMFTSQTINILPLYLNMVPEEKKKEVLNTLIGDIVKVHDSHLDTGIVGTKYIFDVLTDNGYSELAYKVATQKTYPGFGYMIEEGATTLWERWEKLTSTGMNSHNHIMFGSIDAWFYRVLAGIKPKEAGWNKILFEPHPIGDLKYVKASVNTIKGPVEISWEKNENSFLLSIFIPVNSEGEVRIPKIFDKFVIKENDKIVYEKSGDAIEKENYVSFTLGAGWYFFKLEKI
ncbi:MAG TPA: family 78 glycoside hydrolase catalytic domain [Dictyoglomaceae bacterium]|nr:family 78 glycoside hydrolase catalytic domain [Dictyoglomaceae bacterium]